MKYIRFLHALFVTGIGSTLSAQISFPDVTLAGPGAETRLAVAPSFSDQNVQGEDFRLKLSFSMREAHYPKDSLATVRAERAAAWLARLPATASSPYQLDFLGSVAARANDLERAQRYFETRLATPALSVSNRAASLQTAIEVFIDPYAPQALQRLEIAKRYLTQLDAMGDTVRELRYSVRSQLVQAYFALGERDSVVQYGLAAIGFFRQKQLTGGRALKPVFLATVISLADQPEGRSVIERLCALVRDSIAPTPAELADTTWKGQMARINKSLFDEMLDLAARTGTAMPVVKAHFWLNSAHAGYAEQSLADGKIRIIEFGDFGCPGCLMGIGMMNRLHERYRDNPNVEVMYVTNTYGVWAGKAAAPAEEVAGLQAYYLNKRGVQFPIAIWAPPRDSMPNGDFSVPESENKKAFGVERLKPQFYVIDGAGRLRLPNLGGGFREREERIIELVDYLLLEQPRQHATANRTRDVARQDRPATSGSLR